MRMWSHEELEIVLTTSENVELWEAAHAEWRRRYGMNWEPRPCT